jgi:hypothetical protein
MWFNEPIIDRCLDQAARVCTWWTQQSTTDASSVAPTSTNSNSTSTFTHFVSRVGTFIDQTAYKIQWRDALMRFDDQSPISHLTLVRIATAALAIPVARITLQTLARKK